MHQPFNGLELWSSNQNLKFMEHQSIMIVWPCAELEAIVVAFAAALRRLPNSAANRGFWDNSGVEWTWSLIRFLSSSQLPSCERESAPARVIRSSFRVYDEREPSKALFYILDLSLSCFFVCLLLSLLPKIKVVFYVFLIKVLGAFWIKLTRFSKFELFIVAGKEPVMPILARKFPRNIVSMLPKIARMVRGCGGWIECAPFHERSFLWAGEKPELPLVGCFSTFPVLSLNTVAKCLTFDLKSMRPSRWYRCKLTTNSP